MDAAVERRPKRLARRSLSPEQAQTALWPEPDLSGCSQKDRQRYHRLKSALVDYIGGDKVARIEERYDLRISQVQEQLWRATQLDWNDKPLGFLALIPNLQVVETTRRKPLPNGMHPSAARCKGGLKYVLDAEGLYDEFLNRVLKRGPGPHLSTVSPRDLQIWITGELTARGYKKSDYPFNTRRPLYSSIAKLVKEIQNEDMPAHVQANESETAAGNLPVQSGHTVRQPRPDPLEEVEADEHKLHSIGCVRITIDGIDKLIPTERAVGIAIVCRGSNVVLGGAVCLNPEAKEEALIEAIRSAVIPGYVVRLPSGEPAPPFRPCDFYPELGGAVWTVMRLDNAKIHTGNLYQATAAQLGTQSCFGPLGSWSGRPHIEGVFGQLVEGYFKKLPSTTGSGEEHTGRRAPAEQAVQWEIVHDDLCRLFYQGLAQINLNVSSGILNQKPVDYVWSHFKGPKQPILRRLPPVTALNPEVGVQPVRVKARRRSKTNPNMYINYAGAKYSNAALSVRADLLDEHIIVHPQTNLRAMPAFELCGRSLGELVADGHWGASDHTAEIRRAVNADKDLRFGQHGQDKTPIQTMLEKKGRQLAAKNNKRKRGEIVKGGLAFARQMEATSTPHLDIQTADSKTEITIPAVTTTTAALRARQARQALEARQRSGNQDDQ
jgi:putative transposase